MFNIILIGMPSCGKSTIGVLLAKSLGYRFLDSDILLQEKEGKQLHQLLDEHGLDGFLQLENQLNASLTLQNTVLATGGSAIYGKEAMEHLRSLGTVIYLKIDLPTLQKRLGDYTHRGVAMKKNDTLADLYDERLPLYEKYADITIEEKDSTSMGDILQQILSQYQQQKPQNYGVMNG